MADWSRAREVFHMWITLWITQEVRKIRGSSLLDSLLIKCYFIAPAPEEGITTLLYPAFRNREGNVGSDAIIPGHNDLLTGGMTDG